MQGPKRKPTISGYIDGNAYAIMGATKKALRRAGADDVYITAYITKAQSGDYSNLLCETMKVVNLNPQT